MPSIQLFRGVTGLALFLVAISHSQVVIRQRIAIDPKPVVQPQVASAANATLRYELQYDGPVRSPELDFMRLQELVCGVFDSGPINSSLTVPAQSGLWNFSFRIHTPIVSNQYARFTVWLGEDVILKDSLLINCGSTCQINHQFGFRISNTFDLEANGQIFYSERSFLSANAAGQQHCTTQMWHPGLPVNLRIVSGQGLGQFADLNGNPLGHEVTVQGFNVDQVTFLANGTEPDSISDFVTIEASSFGITRTATIEVLRISESPIWLAMDAQGDVSYGAEMSVLAQALNMFQQEVSAGPGVTYTFEIIGASEWGTLFRGAVEGSIISGVRPTDDFFSRGMATIGFRARKTEPAIPQRVTVRVSASNPDIHPGTYSFNVLPSPLAITVTPSTISNGQTATISVQKKNPDGTVSPWLQDAGFSYEIIKGQNGGYILHPDTARRDDFFDGQSDTLSCKGLPAIRRFTAEPEDITSQYPSVDEVSDPDSLIARIMENRQATIYQGHTIGPSAPPSSFVDTTFLNTLVSYKHQAFALGWVKEEGIVTNLDAKLEAARLQIIAGRPPAKQILQSFVNELEALNTRGNLITSEAYALLKFNAEYLLERLK